MSEIGRWLLSAPLNVLQAGVENLLDAMKFRAPQILHLLEVPVNFVETRIHMTAQLANTDGHVAETRIVDQDPHEYSNHCWHSGQHDRKDLISVHHYLR